MKVNNVQVEFLKNPIGIDIKNPRITWNDEGLVKQIAYEVSYSINNVSHTTGEIESSSMNHEFNDSFNSRDIVEFKVRVKDENGNWSEYSDVHSFEFGLLNDKDWSAKWITGNYRVNKNKRYPVDYFKKVISLKEIKKARLYITACGLYEASINGKRVGDFILAPGTTDYRKRIQYQTYDVTELLNSGDNEIKILLADGWYRGSIGAKGFTNVFGKQTKLLAQLEVIDNEGNIATFITDNSWDWSNDGEIRFADLKDGEHIDSRLIPSYKNKAKEVEFSAILCASNNTFVLEQDVATPISISKTPSGRTLLEFPNNIAGYVAFDVVANEGDYINFEMGEMLDAEGELTLKNVQCIRKGKRTPLQEVRYICKKGENHYHPKFFLAGFKYISIDSNIEIKKDDFKQIAIYSDIKQISEFDCSNELINIFFENTLRSLRSNSIDIPTDCPTRERMGWTGDSQVFFESASFLTDYAAFTRKHLVDVFDRQDKNGRLPQIAPYSAEDWFMDVMNGSVGWADVGVLTPYRFFKKYGDKRILIDNFDNMEKYAKFMIKRCGRTKGIYSLYAKPLHMSKENKKYQVNTGQSYGEWAEPNDVKAVSWLDFCEPHPEESMAYTAWIMHLMVEICDLVGRTENKGLYQEYADGVTKAYQELVTKPKFSLDTNRQAKLVRPLHMHLLNEEQEKFAKERLVKALEFYNWRLGTGFLSTPFILSVLSDIDHEYAYKLLENEEMPGWLYMSKNNTGTIWEGWEGPNAQLGISSLNHYSKGAMVEWLFNGMCGINIVSENELLIKPVVGGKETYANATYKSIYGEIKSCWKKENGKTIFDVVIPGNVKARFEYKGLSQELTSGVYHFEF